MYFKLFMIVLILPPVVNIYLLPNDKDNSTGKNWIIRSIFFALPKEGIKIKFK